MSPGLRAYIDRGIQLEEDRRWGYKEAAKCQSWKLWCTHEAVWWAVGKITPEAVEEEFGDEGYLVCEQYRAFLEGANEAWTKMLKVLSCRNCRNEIV